MAPPPRPRFPPACPEDHAVAEIDAHQALWKRIWADKTVEIAVLAVMLGVLTGVFFFQTFATRNERVLFWFRMGYLTVTLVWLGWYANAQLSVVNVLTLFANRC